MPRENTTDRVRVAKVTITYREGRKFTFTIRQDINPAKKIRLVPFLKIGNLRESYTYSNLKAVNGIVNVNVTRTTYYDTLQIIDITGLPSFCEFNEYHVNGDTTTHLYLDVPYKYTKENGVENYIKYRDDSKVKVRFLANIGTMGEGKKATYKPMVSIKCDYYGEPITYIITFESINMCPGPVYLTGVTADEYNKNTNQSPTFTCDICAKVCSSAQELSTHKATGHPYGEKVRCSICGQEVKSDELSKHKQSVQPNFGKH